MKKLLAVLAVVAFAVPMAHAGSGLGVYVSQWDAEDADDPGIGGGIKFKMEMMPQIALELRASYFQDFLDDGAHDDLILIPLEADVVIDFPVIPDMLTLSVGGGAGYYIWPEYESDIPLGDGSSVQPDIDPDDEFGFFIVGGAELQLNEQLALFAEAKMNFLEMEQIEVDEDTLDETEFEVDGSFDGLQLNAGLLLLW